MSVFLGVDEVANLLGITFRAVQKSAKGGKYTTRQVPAKGGKGGLKYEIALSSLPKSAQEKYIAEQAKLAVARLNEQANMEEIPQAEQALKDYVEQQKQRQKAKENGLKQFAKLPKAKKDHATAKQRLLMACYQFIRERQLKKQAGIWAFCEAVNSNQGLNADGDGIQLSPYLQAIIPERRGVKHLNPASFKRWIYDYEAVGILALVDEYGNRAGQSIVNLNPELKGYVLGFILKYPHAGGSKIKMAIQAQKPELDIVGVRSLERFINQWKEENAQIWTYVTHPDKWKNVYMPAYGSHFEGIERLNQLWEMDSTPGDWLLTDGRHSVLGVIDLYSRRMSFYVSKTSSAEAVCCAFRKAVLDWGVPERIRTDNGKDYVSEHFSTALIGLEIVQDLCIPFASEEKGTIERTLGTMSHGLLELLPGFAGHNVAEAQQIRGMKSFAERIMTPGEVIEVAMTAMELQATLDKWALHVYGQDKHSGLNGRSPNQMAALYGGSVRRISNERALDILLAETAATRLIGKKGIRFNGRDYIAVELAEHTGKAAILKYDEADIGRLYVYVDSEFVCVAECPEITGISQREVAIVTKKHIKKQLTAQAKEMKAYKKEIADDIVNRVIEHRVETSENVEWFPRPAVEHTTPALEQAEKAEAFALQNKMPTVSAMGGIDLAVETAKVIDFINRGHEEDPVQMNDVERWRYWNRLDEKQRFGEALNEKELSFYMAYQKTRMFKSFVSVNEDLAIKGG